MEQIASGFKIAKKITKHFAKTFYLASFFLPQDKRLASYAVYAICRISDESVDSLKGNCSELSLKELRKKIDLAYTNAALNNNLLSAFRKTVNTYSIPKEYFYELIDGMNMDLVKNRYADFEELKEYCFKAAGVVGLIMLKIFGAKDAKAEKFASDLGIAMQLTNILRDIKEDALRGRIYIPLNEFKNFKISEADIISGKINDDFKRLMQHQIKRAREYYQESEKGLSLINNPKSRFVATAMKEMYQTILDEIKNNHYNVFNQRAHVNKFKKLLIIIKILLKRK